MPTATFSRRKSKRQASSDIEDDRPSQSRHVDQVEGDQDDSRLRQRGANGVKKEKKPAITKKRGSGRDEGNKDAVDGDGDDDDDDDDGTIDVDNFHDQPLRRADVAKLQGISRDWNMMDKEVRPNWRVVGDVAVALAETGEGDDMEEGLAELDKIMKGLIDISAEMQANGRVLDEIAQRIGQGEEVDDAVNQYEAGVQKQRDDYAQKTARQKYAKSDEYNSFRSGIYEVQHPDKGMPPITEFLPREDGDESDDDDELEIGGVSQNYNCPITLTPLVKPVTSRICKHSFSHDAIMQSFRRDDRVKCPAAGCNKTLTKADLQLNKDLEKRVKAYERRQRRAAENSDADEIID
ncbi:hypothetical protein DXG03_004852 [Asterophora parasitica]|uniref:SP-RING-type domain-containing protein n=1 Tax=Asterophora parasitica TaxID=117018 RepID=A0A9P7GJS0_9AGAR|nr:hypothetical protein DXG03_004852 [Asterophora parasitica]